MEVNIHINNLLESFYKYKKYDDEVFKFLKYPGVNKYKYVISNYGRVFSFVNEKELKYHFDKDGYKRIGIIRIIDGKKLKSPIGIHRMVAFTFVKNKDDKCNIVNHLDGDKSHNYYKNLEWTTPGGNTRHALLMGLQINSGPNAPNSVYSEELVRMICADLEAGMDCFEIYKSITGDNKIINKPVYALIFSIKSGKRHKEISDEYDIPNSILSKTKPKFSNDEILIMKKMINAGCSNKVILEYFCGEGTTKRDTKGRRYYDKILNLRKHMEKCSTIRES